jgi:hypothetical protein
MVFATQAFAGRRERGSRKSKGSHAGECGHTKLTHEMSFRHLSKSCVASANLSAFAEPPITRRGQRTARAEKLILDNPEQPQDEDQDQNSSKTDVHDKLLCLVLAVKRGAVLRRSTRYGCGREAPRYYFTTVQ